MRIKEFIRENKFVILTIFLLGLVTYIIKLTTFSFSIDTEVMLNNSENQLLAWLSIERYGLVFIKKIYNLMMKNIALTNILSFMFLYISVILCIYNINYISKNKSKIANIILGAIIITSPIILEQFNFTLQVLEITLSLMLFNMAFILINRFVENYKKIILLIPIIAFMILSFSCYQSFIPLYILFSIFLFILYYEKNEDFEKSECFKVILTYIVIFICSYALYKIIGIIIINNLNMEKVNYLTIQINWGKENIIVTIIRTILCIGSTLIPVLYPQLYNIGAIVCFIIFLVYIKKDIQNKKYLLAIATFSFLLAPFILNIVIGGYSVARSQIMITYAAAFASYYIFKNCNRKKLKNIFTVFISLIIIYQISVSILLLYTDYNSYKKQINLANEIYKQVNIEKPIIFIGKYEASGKNILLKGETLGKTFFEWDKKTNIGSNNRIYGFFKAIGLEYIKAKDEDIISEIQKEHNGENLIIENENYTVVNLNNVNKSI